MQAPRTGGSAPRGHLILIGATVRAAAESAAGDGWAVSAVDLFGDADTRSAARTWHPLPPVAELARTVARLPPGGVMVTGGVEQWYEALEAIRSEREVWVPSAETLRRVREPALVREIARSCGFAFPDSTEPGERERPEGWLVKSRCLSGGLGVRRAMLSHPTSDDYYQRLAAGRPYGVAFLASDVGIELIGATRSMTRAIGSRPFLYGGSVGPIRIDAELRDRLIRLGETIRGEVGMRGLFGVDLLCPTNGADISLLEINPRYTAGMELIESGRGSLVTAHVDAFRNTCAPLGVSPSIGSAATCRVKRVVWAPQSLRWEPSWQQRIVGGAAGVTLHDIPQPASRIDAGQPVVTLKAEGAETGECLRRVRCVERQLMRSIVGRGCGFQPQ